MSLMWGPHHQLSFKALGIVGSGIYDTIECGSKDMSLEKYILILEKIKSMYLLL